MGQLMRASGTFEVTMAATNGNDGAKGAKPIMLYWDECASTFQFKAGVGGEDVYHIVWETRSATPGTATAFLCIATHTKSSTKPSADSTHWQRLSNLAMIATDLMLTRQILASEIDVDNLTVKNVNAVSRDGKTTAKIDGATGKLTAKNAEFDGVTAKNADVSGKVTATSGMIGGLQIDGVALTNEGFNTDSYIVMRNDNDKRFCAVGANVLDDTFGPSKAMARFENCSNPSSTNFETQVNYAERIQCQNAKNNVAIHIDGGYVSGFAWKNLTVKSSITLSRYDNNILCINTSEITVSLPVMQTYDDGHVVRIKRLGSAAVKLKCSSCYTFNGTANRYSAPVLIYDAGAYLLPSNTLTIESVCDAMELVWVRDITYTIDSTTYYGAWVQYKIPRNW